MGDDKDNEKKRALVFTEHMAASLFLLYLVLPTVSMTQFRGLDCQQFESGHWYLRVDTSVWCDGKSEERGTLLGVVIPMLIIYQSIPLMYTWLLVKHRERLNPRFKDQLAARRKRERDPVLAPLRFLYEDYKCEQWGFEIFEMYRR